MPIPRYFRKWLQKEHPGLWTEYVVGLESKHKLEAFERAELEAAHQKKVNQKRVGLKGPQVTKLEHKRKIALQKFNQSKDLERM